MTDKEPNILFLDIETSPIIAYTWGPKYEAGLIENIEESQVLCYSAKWFGGKQKTKGLIDCKGYRRNIVNDKQLLVELHDYLDKADIVISQNGISFDHKVLNARFIKHDMNPPSPYKMVDTKIEAKKYLRLSSYSLDDMGKYFNIGNKLHHEGFDLWKKCIAGDINAWNTMKKYNAQDVLLLERLYLKLRPFMKTHPNVTSYQGIDKPLKVIDTGKCPRCGSEHTHARGYVVNSVSKYARAQCQACGSWYRYGTNLMKNKKLGISI